MEAQGHISEKVRNFYGGNTFPDFNIEKYSSAGDLIEQAGWFYKLLDFYVPSNAKVIDVGCGTGQFACLLATKPRRVLGVDFSQGSLAKADLLKDKLGLSGANFINRDLLAWDIPEESFDYTFCLGVLHHTADPCRGFKNLVRVTKTGGFVIVGLYNKYGRLWLSVNRALLRLFPSLKAGMLRGMADRQLGEGEKDKAKIHSWYLDQYAHPHESTHSIGEVMSWFRAGGVSYVSSFPPLEWSRGWPETTLARCLPNPFRRHSAGSFQAGAAARLLAQLKWAVTLRDAGGYFIMVGRKGKITKR